MRPSAARRGKAVAAATATAATAVAALAGAARPARAEALEPRVLMAFTANINFQPAGAAIPADYKADTGATYASRGGGLTYGWDQSNTSNTRDRNSALSPDQRYDTFAYTQRSGRSYRWELAVPSGLYTVRVVAGDPTSTDSTYAFNVEGKLALSGTPNASRRWIEGTVVTPVTDGRLTLTNATSARNNKVNFVTVHEIVPQSFKARAISPHEIVLSWNDMPVVESAYRIERSQDGVNFSQIAQVGANVLTYLDSNRTPGVTYTYRVRGVADGVASGPSDASAASIVLGGLDVTFGNAGPSKVAYKGVTLFDLARNPGEGFQAYEFVFKQANGTLRKVGGAPQRTTWDPAWSELTLHYAWGTVACRFIPEGHQLRMQVRVNNTGTETLTSLTLSPMTFRFPGMPDAFGGAPQFAYNVNGPTVVAANYGSGQALFVNEDVSRPLTVGYASNNTTNSQFNYNLLISSAGRGGPAFERPIAPGKSDTYDLAVRFSYAGFAPETLASDVYANYRAAFPATLNWTDRRAIASIFFYDVVPSGISATNPHGWWGDPTVDTFTPAGLAKFKARFLADADVAIGILRNMNAQGMIVWDVEGELHQGAIYIGDPRVATQTMPELGYQNTLDEYFRRFTNAGLRVGVTLRPTKFTATSPTTGTQTDVADPAALLIEKARFARDRWGATLFYIDSNDAFRPQDVARVAAALPDCLFIPEHEAVGSYGFSAPYAEVRRGDLSTPNPARAAYTNSFSVIEATMNVGVEHRTALVNAVRAGDILLFQGWWDNPANAVVKSIYDEAKGPVP